MTWSCRRCVLAEVFERALLVYKSGLPSVGLIVLTSHEAVERSLQVGKAGLCSRKEITRVEVALDGNPGQAEGKQSRARNHDGTTYFKAQNRALLGFLGVATD